MKNLLFIGILLVSINVIAQDSAVSEELYAELEAYFDKYVSETSEVYTFNAHHKIKEYRNLVKSREYAFRV